MYQPWLLFLKGGLNPDVQENMKINREIGACIEFKEFLPRCKKFMAFGKLSFF